MGQLRPDTCPWSETIVVLAASLGRYERPAPAIGRAGECQKKTFAPDGEETKIIGNSCMRQKAAGNFLSEELWLLLKFTDVVIWERAE